MKEARNIWPNRPIGCVVSLGCGKVTNRDGRSGRSGLTYWAGTLLSMPMEVYRIHKEFQVESGRACSQTHARARTHRRARARAHSYVHSCTGSRACTQSRTRAARASARRRLSTSLVFVRTPVQTLKRGRESMQSSRLAASLGAI
eukprot:6181265-Pleurochrysis_carterae.AAC.3